MILANTSLLLGLACLLLLTTPTAAFGAGNIASIAKIEGQNWRHGDIEDVLATVAHLKGYKWSSIMIKRVYFGNWLRDYSQAVDVGTLKGVQAEVIRVLVWILAFMSFGYATREFEVTSERLGVYRPEEHEDYADNADARQYDPRLRGPVEQIELAIDPETGMKNYIANERGGWATSSGYIKHSFTRSIHFGRIFTSGASGTRGNEADLFEALRCLGQGLHCLEDFGAHTNYVELALREQGFHDVFTHTGSATEMDLHGRRLFPLVTGTFGGVDFLHSVIGEATDHVTQSEVDQMDKSLQDAGSGGGDGTGLARGFDGPQDNLSGLTDLLGQVPGTSDFCREATQLQRDSDAQATQNAQQQQEQSAGNTFAPPPKIDLQTTISKIYPILAFRDNVMRAVNAFISKIPGLEKLIDTISEKITLFVMSLLAPYIIPVINTASAQLKVGSSAVVQSSGKHQFGPWEDPVCTAPTHSLLSKDHFSNILNGPAGAVAAAILQYVAPRVVYAWEHPEVPVEQVLDDCVRAFHHPALRQHGTEIHQTMFRKVEEWVARLPDRGASLNDRLGAESVKRGGNHSGGHNPHMGEGSAPGIGSIIGGGSHGKPSSGPFSFLTGGTREMPGGEFDYGSLASDTTGQSHYQTGYTQQYEPPPAESYAAGYQQPAPQDYGYQQPAPQEYGYQQGYGYEQAPYEGGAQGYEGYGQQQQYPQQAPPPNEYGQLPMPPGGYGEPPGDQGYGYGQQWGQPRY